MPRAHAPEQLSCSFCEKLQHEVRSVIECGCRAGSRADASMLIREFRSGDEPGLHRVFLSAVHEIAIRDYTAEQVDAWAPRSIDAESWAQRMREISPYVVEHEGVPVAYADLQAGGYIDHFFVSGAFAGRGVGAKLMQRIHDSAQIRGTSVLTSDVSVTAQPFFRRFGFSLVEARHVLRRGVAIPNALMRKQLSAQAAADLRAGSP